MVRSTINLQNKITNNVLLCYHVFQFSLQWTQSTALLSHFMESRVRQVSSLSQNRERLQLQSTDSAASVWVHTALRFVHHCFPAGGVVLGWRVFACAYTCKCASSLYFCLYTRLCMYLCHSISIRGKFVNLNTGNPT